MTIDRLHLAELIEKGSDADLLRDTFFNGLPGVSLYAARKGFRDAVAVGQASQREQANAWTATA